MWRWSKVKDDYNQKPGSKPSRLMSQDWNLVKRIKLISLLKLSSTEYTRNAKYIIVFETIKHWKEEYRCHQIPDTWTKYRLKYQKPQYWILSTQYQIQKPHSKYRILNTKYTLTNIWYQILNTKYLISNAKYSIPVLESNAG